jgi:hypothetical protein
MTLSTSRRCVVATDDEVIAGEKPAVELAKPKRRDGHGPNNGRGDEPTPGRYLLISRNGHSQKQRGEERGSGESDNYGQVEQCP